MTGKRWAILGVITLVGIAVGRLAVRAFMILLLGDYYSGATFYENR